MPHNKHNRTLRVLDLQQVARLCGGRNIYRDKLHWNIDP